MIHADFSPFLLNLLCRKQFFSVLCETLYLCFTSPTRLTVTAWSNVCFFLSFDFTYHSRSLAFARQIKFSRFQCIVMYPKPREFLLFTVDAPRDWPAATATKEGIRLTRDLLAALNWWLKPFQLIFRFVAFRSITFWLKNAMCQVPSLATTSITASCWGNILIKTLMNVINSRIDFSPNARDERLSDM